jgi:electron transfer flavoprotein alpha/beta subunit
MSSMRIATGFKVTPDYEALRASGWARAAAHGVETRYVRRILNCFDESALELALRLRDARAQHGLETRLAAFSVAGREALPFLKTLQALGLEDIALVETRSGAGAGSGDAEAEPGAALDFAPAATAGLIAASALYLGGDVLLLGCRSGPGDAGTVPFLVAESLGRPCLTQVTEIEPLDDHRLRVTFAADDGLVRATVRPPCVLAIGNAVVSHLRVPTLKDRLGVKQEPVTMLSPGDLGVDLAAALAGEPAMLTRLEVIDRRRAGVIVEGSTPAEKARRLYD